MHFHLLVVDFLLITISNVNLAYKIPYFKVKILPLLNVCLSVISLVKEVAKLLSCEFDTLTPALIIPAYDAAVEIDNDCACIVLYCSLR